MRAAEYISGTELRNFGFASVGRHVYVSRAATVAYPERISLGNYVRIDPFSLLIAREKIAIGDHVHIGSSVTINAFAPVTIGNFSGISAGSKIFTTDDDYGGDYLTGPTVEPDFTNITTAQVVIEDHCIVGANSVLLPGTILGEGVAVGALSLVKGSLDSWGIYGGVPAKLLKPRSRALLTKAAELADAEQRET